MPDITMCTSKDCPLQNECYRQTATPNEYWQSYSDFYKGYERDGRPECDHFIRIESEGE